MRMRFPSDPGDLLKVDANIRKWMQAWPEWYTRCGSMISPGTWNSVGAYYLPYAQSPRNGIALVGARRWET